MIDNFFPHTNIVTKVIIQVEMIYIKKKNIKLEKPYCLEKVNI